MMAPGLPQIAEHFHETNPTIIGMSLSITLLAWVFSPLILAPLSEVYGRECILFQVPVASRADIPPGRWLYHISNLITIAFTLGCAFAPTMGSFIGFRFLGELQSPLFKP